MPLIYPSFEELSQQARAELRRRRPEIDPSVFGSFARPFMDSAAALAYSINQLNRDLSVQLFPQGAEGEFLDRWGDYEGLSRNPAAPAQGVIDLPGTAGTIIPVGTLFQGGNNLTYEASQASVIQVFPQLILTLTRSGGLVTAITMSDHGLATGLDVTIAGANETEYNGTFSIVVTARNEFTYLINTSPSTPATGTITLSATYAPVQVVATAPGSGTNLPGGATLTLQNTIVGAEDAGLAGFDGLSGGTEVESDSLYRARVLLSRSIIEGVFTADQIKLAALSVPGNTRAFVVRATLSVADPDPGPGMIPAPGQVVVYVLRDGDANIIPTPTILALTKQAIIEDGALPAHTSVVDVFVFAPTPVPVNFVFSSLSPDTPTMRTAVFNSLQAFFDDKVDFESTVFEAAFLGAIQNTQDLTTGAFLQSFSLSAPIADVIVASGEIAILGSVVFP